MRKGHTAFHSNLEFRGSRGKWRIDPRRCAVRPPHPSGITNVVRQGKQRCSLDFFQAGSGRPVSDKTSLTTTGQTKTARANPKRIEYERRTQLRALTESFLVASTDSTHYVPLYANDTRLGISTSTTERHPRNSCILWFTSPGGFGLSCLSIAANCIGLRPGLCVVVRWQAKKQE